MSRFTCHGCQCTFDDISPWMTHEHPVWINEDGEYKYCSVLCAVSSVTEDLTKKIEELEERLAIIERIGAES